MWKSFKPVSGISVPGDKAQSPLSQVTIIRHLQKLVALKWQWDTLAVLEVENNGEPYLVGFTDTFGQTAIRTVPITTPRFAGLLGHENCMFFAIRDMVDPRPLKLKFIERRAKDYPVPPDVTVI